MSDTASSLCERIREHIRPFPRETRYVNGWTEPLTYAEIYDALCPGVTRLLSYYRNPQADIPDMVAHGFMRLWEALVADPDLLADKDLGGAIKYVMNRRAGSVYKKWYRREFGMLDLVPNSGDPEEFVIEGYGSGYHEGHARFTRVVDLRCDITDAMTRLSEKYADSLPHLAALYYITTEVSCEDAASLAGRGGSKRSWWMTSIVKPIREELRDMLGIPKQEKITWQDRIKDDENPMETLINKFKAEGNSRMVTTLSNLWMGQSCKELQECIDAPMTTVSYLRRTAHRHLNDVYGCSR